MRIYTVVFALIVAASLLSITEAVSFKVFDGASCTGNVIASGSLANNTCGTVTVSGITSYSKVVCDGSNSNSTYSYSQYSTSDCSGSPIQSQSGTGVSNVCNVNNFEVDCGSAASLTLSTIAVAVAIILGKIFSF